MPEIKDIKAREILDSRGNPTLEVDLYTKSFSSRASVPSGASTGSHEAVEMRDGGQRYHGKGVRKAALHVNHALLEVLKGVDCTEQENVDRAMVIADESPNKARLGANAILGVSLASARAGAQAHNLPLFKYISQLADRKPMLPIPMMNIINGGKHAGNNLDIQEYMILPSDAENMHEAVRIGSEVYHELKKIISKKYGKSAVNVGDEGGFAPQCKSNEEPFELIMSALEELGYTKRVELAIDAAATSFHTKKGYMFENRQLSVSSLLDWYMEMVGKYPLVSIEDPFMEGDFTSFAGLTRAVGYGKMVVGDDLLCTNPVRIQKAITVSACNSLLLKVNQIGTLTEAIESAKLAFEQDWKVIVSHRSGETTDPFIADLATGLGCGYIKAGAPCRGERVAKYNRLLRIEETNPDLPYGLQ